MPASRVPGEAAWPTQPVPRRPPPLVRQAIGRDELSTVTPESNRACTALFDSATTGPLFTPAGPGLTLTFPGMLGGANWSGAAFDPSRHRLYLNVNEVGALGGMQRFAHHAPSPGGARAAGAPASGTEGRWLPVPRGR